MPNDTPLRHQAINPTQSFIVQAPAGSGKTELLMQRYLALLLHAQKAPEEIVAITFTRKSASEMRARILQALLFATEPEPDKNDYRHTTWSIAKAVLKKNEALNWQLQHNPNRLRILTIDALSAFLCHQTPLLTQFGATPTIGDNAKPLYQLAAQKLLTDILPNLNDQSAIEHLLLHLDNNVEKLAELLTNLLSHREQWLSHIMHASSHHHALHDMLNQSLQHIMIEKMQLAAQTVPAHLKQTLLLLACHAGSFFAENAPENLLANCAELTFDKNNNIAFFPMWSAFANLLLTANGEWRKSVSIRNGFSPKDPNKLLMQTTLIELAHCTPFQSCLHEIQLLPPTSFTHAQCETITALTQLLPLLVAQLRLIFQEKEQMDFIELNLAALKALGDDDAPTDLALYLDYQIRHLLIDEFQDTSVMHLHLLEKLTAGWQPNDGRTLFLVGDPMQSIYRFRHAEVGLFLRAQEQGIGNIKLTPLTLTMNFRSQSNLVDWFNNTFETIFPAVSDIATGRVPYTKTVSAKPAHSNHTANFYPIANGDDALEAEKIAETIAKIKIDNPNDSIALLVRTRAQVPHIIHALQNKKLSFDAIDIEPLAKHQVIQDLLSLTRALLHRKDHIAWLAILRSPLCGLMLADLEIIAKNADPKTIWEVLLHTEYHAALSKDALLRIQKLRYDLQIAFEKQGQLNLSDWIEQTWIALNGPVCLTHETELNYVRAYFNLVLSMENSTTPFSIEALIDQCDNLFSNTQSVDPNPIQILTIHKSKGLEFDHVFLPGLHRKPPANQSKLFRWLDRVNAFGSDDLILAPIKSMADYADPIYDYLKRVEKEKNDYEITRLLYVAATRAKKSLHLFAIVEHDAEIKKPKIGSFLEKMWSIYESDSSNWFFDQAHFQEPHHEKRINPLSRLPSHWFHFSENNKIQKNISIDIALHSQQSRVIGTVIHEILQYHLENKPQQWHSRLLSLGILSDNIVHCMNIIQQAVKNMQSDPRAQWMLSDQHQNAHSEWMITYRQENETNHYIIDRSFIENNTRWIIDYKTSLPAENEFMADFLQREKEKYQSQLNRYATVVAQMENQPIKLGLYFPMCCGWVEWDE